MPDSSEHAGRGVGPILLARLAELKKSQRWLADKLKLSPTFISLVIQGERTLTSYDAQRAAAILGIPGDKLLRAAGHDVNAVSIADLGAKIATHSAGRVTVVSDPRFLDSALFLAICAAQPFASAEIEFDIVAASWASVPDVLATRDEALAFFNHRLIREHPTHRKLVRWNDLCVYRGYAILGRTDTFDPAGSPADHHDALLRLISEHDERHKLEIVTIGLDTEAVAEDWIRAVLPKYRSRIRVFPSHDADFALEEFMSGELGDLFVGGLPQRAEAWGRCVEVTSSQADPLLFSYNSLLCTPALHANRRNILYLVSNLWSEVVRRMYSDATFRQRVADECVRVVTGLGVASSRMTVSADRIVQMFTPIAKEPFSVADAALSETESCHVFDRTISSADDLLSRDTELFISGPRDVSDAYLRIVGEAVCVKMREKELPESTAGTVVDIVLNILRKQGASDSEEVGHS